MNYALGRRKLGFIVLHITQLSVCLITMERKREKIISQTKKLFPGAQSLRF